MVSVVHKTYQTLHLNLYDVTIISMISQIPRIKVRLQYILVQKVFSCTRSLYQNFSPHFFSFNKLYVYIFIYFVTLSFCKHMMRRLIKLIIFFMSDLVFLSKFCKLNKKIQFKYALHLLGLVQLKVSLKRFDSIAR